MSNKKGPVAQRERASIALTRPRVRIPPGPLGIKINGPMAQLGARLNGIEKAEGSSPSGSTKAKAEVVCHPQESLGFAGIQATVPAERIRQNSSAGLI